MRSKPIWTLFWKDGTRQLVRGRNIGEAMRDAGYSAIAAEQVQFHIQGNDHSWIWTDKAWDKVPPGGIGTTAANAGERRTVR